MASARRIRNLSAHVVQGNAEGGGGGGMVRALFGKLRERLPADKLGELQAAVMPHMGKGPQVMLQEAAKVIGQDLVTELVQEIRSEQQATGGQPQNGTNPAGGQDYNTMAGDIALATPEEADRLYPVVNPYTTDLDELD